MTIGGLIEDTVKKWDSSRQNNGAKYVVVEREVTNDGNKPTTV